MSNQPTVFCRLCGKQTPMLGTKLCDGCWELETRIHADPKLAVKILNGIGLVDNDPCHQCGYSPKAPL